MRIAINGSFWEQETTGSGQYVRQLVPALAALPEKDAYTLCLPAAVDPGVVKVSANLSVEPLHIPWDSVHSGLAKLWLEQVSFPVAARRLRVDLVHVPYFAPSRFTGLPTVVTIFDLIPLILPAYRGGAQVRAYMRLVAWAAQYATLVLTDSHAAARDLRQHLHIPPERLRVTYLAAGAEYRPLSRTEVKATLDRLSIRQPYMLYLGGFDQRKNVLGLLRAFARARSALGDVRLVIAGRLPARHTDFAPDPRNLAEELDLGKAVHFIGWVAEADKPALYAGAMAFVFPSFYEGFGLPVLEALACGTPVIVGSGSSLEEIAGPGGLVVPPNDLDALSGALCDLVGDAKLRERLTEAGLAHARTFSWERTARETRQAYQEALEMHRSRGRR
jgi:glycosyltransferase involved in cell wall biosynthesis